MKVVWTEQALSRLEAIFDHVAIDNPVAAEDLVFKLVARGDSLRDFPRRGRPVPEMPGTGYLELIEQKYRIVYRVGASTVEIVTVFEGHRRIRKRELKRRM